MTDGDGLSGTGIVLRLLFSAVPSVGHVFPLLPLMDAAREAGHDVVLLSGAGAASMAARHRVMEVGPSIADAMQEAQRRIVGHDLQRPGAATVEVFAGVRVENVLAPALLALGEFRPDVVVSETLDMVGPLVAAVLGVKRVEHRVGGPLPSEIVSLLHNRVLSVYGESRLDPSEPAAIIDPYPISLRDRDDADSARDRIPIRPAVFAGDEASKHWEPVRSDRPVALVTFGTTVHDSSALSAMVDSVARAGMDVLVTADAGDLELRSDIWPNVYAVGFVPIADLIQGCDLVVCAGGTGTVLAALTFGKPLVIRPFIADQPWNAKRIEDRGLGEAIHGFEEAGGAAIRVLNSADTARALGDMVEAIAQMNSPETVVQVLMSRFAPS